MRSRIDARPIGDNEYETRCYGCATAIQWHPGDTLFVEVSADPMGFDRVYCVHCWERRNPPSAAQQNDSGMARG